LALSQVEVTFDKFHVMKLVSDAVDQTRGQERATHPELKGQRYTLPRKPETMTDAQLEFASSLQLT